MRKILVFVAFFGALLASAQSPNVTKATKNNELKFISFNIRLGSEWSAGQDGTNYWDFRKEAVLAMIQQEDPDVIGMQEVLPGQLHFLDSALSDYHRIGVGREDGNEKGECMAVFFKNDRFMTLSYHTYWLSQTPETVSMGWDAACHRTVTMVALVDMEMRPFLYMNTHLDHVSATARAESMKLLEQLAKEGYAPQMPIVIGGDMNTSADDTIFNSLMAHGFSKARDIAPVSDNEMTFNGFGKTDPIQIDHFFVRNMTVKEFRTLNGDYGVPYISDHYPIMMKVELPDLPPMNMCR